MLLARHTYGALSKSVRGVFHAGRKGRLQVQSRRRMAVRVVRLTGRAFDTASFIHIYSVCMNDKRRATTYYQPSSY